MAQPLSIHIINGEENRIAVGYYRWSGYSSDAADLTRIILEHWGDNQYQSIVDQAVSGLMATGAGFMREELQYIQQLEKNPNNHTPVGVAGGKLKELPCTDLRVLNSSASDGLIAISPNGMDMLDEESLEVVIIDLNAKIVKFGLARIYSQGAFIKNTGCENWDELPQATFNLESIPFDEFDAFVEFQTQTDTSGFKYNYKKGHYGTWNG